MGSQYRIWNLGLHVWPFALGYFIAYIPYVTLARATMQGYLSQEPVSGFDIMPVTLLGTMMTMPLLVALFGGFCFANERRILGFDVPFPKFDTLISGTAFAVIIATTTMAYAFPGVSIVLALVLMRGGVLTIAPITDAAVGRRVDRYSWVALALSLGGVVLALLQVGTYTLTGAALINLALYLCGYVVRLNVITRQAKVVDEAVNRRFFAEECIAAMAALAVMAAVIVLIGSFSNTRTLAYGFGSPAAKPIFGWALLTGVAYGFLGVFATLIYLNPLENTFAVPVNRCASVLSGFVASLLLTWLYDEARTNTANFISAGLIMLAGFVLYFRSMQQPRAPTPKHLRRFLLFVCSGNTSRSPIAQAICNAQIIRRLAGCPRRLTVEVGSAGLTAKAGSPMSWDAQQALTRLSIPVPPHASRNLTPELIEDATVIICMTRRQCDAVIAINPAASGKVLRLHPFRDLNDPSGWQASAFLKLAHQIQYLVALRLSYFLLLGCSRTW
jgi:protein-tyrosine-phosphatase